MYHVTTLSAWRAGAVLVAAGMLAAGCSSASSTPAGSSATGPGATAPAASGGTQLKTGHTSLGTTLEDSRGFVVYWFAKDHGMTSACSGACAGAWPPVTGMPAAAGGMALPGKLGTIKRTDGSTQATYNGHPLYTFSGDSSPGQANGNGVNGFGGLWYAITLGGSGGTPSNSPSTSGGGGGYGY